LFEQNFSISRNDFDEGGGVGFISGLKIFASTFAFTSAKKKCSGSFVEHDAGRKQKELYWSKCKTQIVSPYRCERWELLQSKIKSGKMLLVMDFSEVFSKFRTLQNSNRYDHTSEKLAVSVTIDKSKTFDEILPKN